jgi:hypothetical protein
MSDLQKALKRQSSAPWVKTAEAGERAEGLRDSLVAGKGDAVAGGKKLHYRKPGLAAAEKLATKAKGGDGKRGRR